MSPLGAVVRCGRTLPLARTLDSVQREAGSLRDVTLVLEPGVDARVERWLTALAARRRWQLARASAGTPGAVFNAGIRASGATWVVLLDEGDELAHDAAARVAGALASSSRLAFVAGDVRLVGLGFEEVVPAGDPASIDAFDSSHPVLRACCWHRDTLIDAGGLDEALAAAVRYEMWLRLLSRGFSGTAANSTLLTVNVEGGAYLDELSGPGYAQAVTDVLARHRDLLASRLSAVLETRARRVSTLGARNAAALARQASALGRTGTCPPPDPAPPRPGDGVMPRRVTPRSRDWGYERGGPIDRVYIERFLERHAGDVHGDVLEVQEADYTRRFGGAVTSSDVVDLHDGNRQATIVSDLRTADNIADNSYDCVIITQTLHVIDDMAAVMAQCRRILRPGGVLLATFPCASRVCLEYGRDGDFWRLTPAGARRLARDAFGDDVAVDVFGNVLATTAFAMGMAPLELHPEELAFTDEYNPTLVGIRAVKSFQGQAPGLRRRREDAGLVLLYHRVADDGPDPHRIALAPTAFERQMAWLSSRCAVLPLPDLVEGARRCALPPRAVAVTFDDGYVDTLGQAASMLEAHGIPATCFVATADLDGAHVFWWDRLAALLLGDGPRPSRLSLSLPDGPCTLATASEGERLHAHFVIYHAIVREPQAAREKVLDALRAWAPHAAPAPGCRRMTAAELCEAQRAGLAFGAHTVRHLHLPQQPFEDQVREVVESRQALERIAGRPVTSFAYPFGAFDDTAARAAREAGVGWAFTCEARRLRADDDPLRLPRVEIQEQDVERFRARVEHALTS